MKSLITPQSLADSLAGIAQQALAEELLTYPKPGLVSHMDSGSHQDMNYELFVSSISSLRCYFYEIAMAGYHNAEFYELEQLGIKAEQQMLVATNNVNTHRGAIFILGLLIAASAYSVHYQLPLLKLSDTLIELYARPLERHKLNPFSHGSRIRQQYQLESIIDAAQNGFPLVFNAVKQLNYYRQCYNDEAVIRVKLLFYIMQYLDDTNLVYRGGIGGLEFARNAAITIVKLSEESQIMDSALKLHQDFISMNLSPGGSADILAATLFVDKVWQLWG